ncbi:hypothetical protein CASFOL_006247 [Castilleja foliolosa]|uniref:Two-component response regulator n=1 Tax=Castilleja foliolosa TaxID=1961234 RepID=A0ABD3E6S2_9LAMI
MDTNKWPDSFPAGLRVLVVDNDLNHLEILQNMLLQCKYEVTTCNLMVEALDLLGETRFDIVISDVNMPDMDGFKLLEHVASKMIKIPVIMMSVDGETSKVMKGIEHDACDFLLKPIRMQEVQNIWQHVARKQIRDAQMMINETKQFGYENKIIKDVADSKVVDRESCVGYSSVKKARVVWTPELHQKFEQAVNQIGIDKVGPKKILELMGVPGLTRENVASHLQKYRLHLKRSQKENELKAASSWIKFSEANVCLQSSSGIRSMTIPTTDHNLTYLPKRSFNHFIEPLVYEELKLEWENKPCFNLEHSQSHLDQLITRPNIGPFCGYNDGVGKVTDDGVEKVTIVENCTGAYSIAQDNVYDNLRSLENLIVGPSQDDIYPLNQSELGSFDFSDQELIDGVPQQMYSSVNYESSVRVFHWNV